MTKRHTDAFARYIKAQIGATSDTDLRTFADIVAAVASDFNLRFDCDRFFQTCGLAEKPTRPVRVDTLVVACLVGALLWYGLLVTVVLVLF